MSELAFEKAVSESSYTIAAQVLFFRTLRGMTQTQLAEASGMLQPAIARLEKTPDKQWTLATLTRVADALDLRIKPDLFIVDEVDEVDEAVEAKPLDPGPEACTGGAAVVRAVAIREKLPLRRFSETVRFDHAGISYRATIGYYADGRIGEVFLDADKSTSDADRIGKEAAILLSLAAQHGCAIETIRNAMPRNMRGEPEGPIGALMDVVVKLGKNDT